MTTTLQTHVALEVRLTLAEAEALSVSLRPLEKLVRSGVLTARGVDREAIESAIEKVATCLDTKPEPF